LRPISACHGGSGFANAAEQDCAWQCPKMHKPKNHGRLALNKRSGRPSLKVYDAQNLDHNRPYVFGFPIRIRLTCVWALSSPKKPCSGN
jgi:hypothetical protein